MDAGGREPNLGRGARSRPPAPLSPLQDRHFLCPAHGSARRSRGRKRKASCAFLFFQPSQPKQKRKGHRQRSRDPPRPLATHLRAVPGGGGGVRARPACPAPQSALRRRGGGGDEPPGQPPSLPARALAARPRRRARAPPLPAAGLGGAQRAGAAARRPHRQRGPTRGRRAPAPPECLAPCGRGPRRRSPLSSRVRCRATRGPLRHPLGVVSCRPAAAGGFGSGSHLELEVDAKSHPVVPAYVLQEKGGRLVGWKRGRLCIPGCPRARNVNLAPVLSGNQLPCFPCEL